MRKVIVGSVALVMALPALSQIDILSATHQVFSNTDTSASGGAAQYPIEIVNGGAARVAGCNSGLKRALLSSSTPSKKFWCPDGATDPDIEVSIPSNTYADCSQYGMYGQFRIVVESNPKNVRYQQELSRDTNSCTTLTM